MSQDTVFKLIEINKEGLTCRKISEDTGVGMSSTNSSLRKLIEQGLVVRIQKEKKREYSYELNKEKK